MTKHGEPWELRHDPDDQWYSRRIYADHTYHKEGCLLLNVRDEDAAKRAVKCVNALADIDNPAKFIDAAKKLAVMVKDAYTLPNEAYCTKYNITDGLFFQDLANKAEALLKQLPREVQEADNANPTS